MINNLLFRNMEQISKRKSQLFESCCMIVWECWVEYDSHRVVLYIFMLWHLCSNSFKMIFLINLWWRYIIHIMLLLQVPSTLPLLNKNNNEPSRIWNNIQIMVCFMYLNSFLMHLCWFSTIILNRSAMGTNNFHFLAFLCF